MDQRIYYGDVEHFSIPLWARIVIKVIMLIIINFVRNSYSLYSKSLTYKQETLQFSQKYSNLFKLSNTLTPTQYSCILDFYIILNSIQM